MTFTLTSALRSAIEAHARAVYPNECCGFVRKGVYAPCENVAADPTQDFKIADDDFLPAYVAGEVEALVHSHPDAEAAPSAADMAQQLAMDLPWIIVGLNADQIGQIVVFGDNDVIAPVLGREFVHGVTDCYSLIRDVFRLGRDRLAEEDVDWPLSPIELPEFPRDDAWWTDPAKNLYVENFAHAGFVEIKREEAGPGDVFLCKVRSDKLNHGGVVIGGGLILHHLPLRLSRREPAGVWQKSADLWLRHVSVMESEDVGS